MRGSTVYPIKINADYDVPLLAVPEQGRAAEEVRPTTELLRLFKSFGSAKATKSTIHVAIQGLHHRLFQLVSFPRSDGG